LLVSGIWLFSAILLTPAVLFRDRGPSSGPADSDGGGGGGTEPPSAPVPMPPSGGVPLSDADPAPVRLRDHDRRGLRRLRLRRPAREPDRAPMPAPPAGDR
jgi:hypothetical protein